MSYTEQPAYVLVHDRARRPDEVGVIDAPPDAYREPTTSWEALLAEDYRWRWDQLESSFGDDPRVAAQEAAHLVDAAVRSAADGLRRHKDLLDDWQQQGETDPDALRVVLGRYRGFLDELLRT